MPQLSDIATKRKFVKKEYRPWDLSGKGTVDGKEKNASVQESEPVKAPDLDVNPTSDHSYSNKADIDNTPTNDVILAPQNELSARTGNISGNKQVTKKEPSGNKEVTIENVKDIIEITTREQIDNKSDNIAGNRGDATYLVNAIKNLSGLQKNIFNFVVNLCAARGVLDTGNVLIIDLTNAAGCTIGSAKTSLIRLVEKKLIQRLPGKASRGGHMVLGITKEIQDATIQAQQMLFNPLSNLITGNKTNNNTGNIPPYSSSNIIKTTTSLGDDWNFEISDFSKLGFTMVQLKQLANLGTLNPSEVEQSLIEFAFDFENGTLPKNIRTSNINFLMGLLRRGTYYISESYRTEQEKIDAEMARRVEDRKKRIREEKFISWEASLTDEDRKRIEQEVPPGLRSHYRTSGISYPEVKTFMMDYYSKISA